MHANHLFAAVSFLVGLLAGFQGIQERYQKDSITALFTLPGITYLISRGIVPAIIFLVLYEQRYLLQTELFLQALLCGTGAELVLRMRFYVKQSQKDGSTEELLKGPFDLLRWYQALFLEAIARYLLGAWPHPQTTAELDTAVTKLKTVFQNESQTTGASAIIEQKYKDKLGYILLNKVGPGGLKTLVSH